MKDKMTDIMKASLRQAVNAAVIRKCDEAYNAAYPAAEDGSRELSLHDWRIAWFARIAAISNDTASTTTPAQTIDE